MYYKEEKTQQEIANRLGLSRIKVLRLLKEARENDIVHIEIRARHEYFLEKEEELRNTFDLDDAVVISAIKGDEIPYENLASAAIAYLQEFLREGMRVGIGLSRTMYLAAQNFTPGFECQCTFVSLTGGLSQLPNGYENQNIILNFAKAMGAKANYMMAPFIVSEPEIKKALQKEESIQKALSEARNCDAMIASLGQINPDSLIFKYTQSGKDDLEEIKTKGAKGDILGRFFDKNGQELEVALRNRTIGININDLKKIPTRIIVAGGKKKREAILAALRGKIPTILITDNQTADWMLQKAKEK